MDSTEEDMLETMGQSELAQELRGLQSATDGIFSSGTVLGIEPFELHDDESVIITVEMPHKKFTEVLRKPKPPVEEYPLTRMAEHYALGLVDVDAFEGEEVGCVYNRTEDSWHIIDPGRPLEHVNPHLGDSNQPTTQTVEVNPEVAGGIVSPSPLWKMLLTLALFIVLLPLPLVYWSYREAKVGVHSWGKAIAMSVFGTLMWLFIWGIIRAIVTDIFL